jgi:hypothetical protein
LNGITADVSVPVGLDRCFADATIVKNLDNQESERRQGDASGDFLRVIERFAFPHNEIQEIGPPQN